MIPEWALTFISGGAGAFIAAWVGAYLGFRRSKKERALDRRVGWHESAIQSLAQYEEQLDPVKKEDLPMQIKVPAALWSELRDAESRARGALRVGDLYAEGRAQVKCSSALSMSVNVVSSQWLDISAEPMIPWAELSAKAYACADLRGSLQESLKVVLELDGIVARTLGPKYRKWRKIGLLKRMLDENVRKLRGAKPRAE